MAVARHGGDHYGYPGEVMDFSINLNPRGTPAPVLEAAKGAMDGCACYPDPHCRSLRRAIAQRDGVPEKWIFCGNGGADLIDRLMWALRPQRVWTVWPTFSEYQRGAAVQQASFTLFGLSPQEGFLTPQSLEEQIPPETDLAILCDPNNPTGQRLKAEQLLRCLHRCRRQGTWLMIDQCFLELSQGEDIPWERELAQGGVILLRAMTKSYALAGLRLGYALCGHEALLDRMGEVGQPWPLSIPAQEAGRVAYEEYPTWPQESLPLILQERQTLSDLLEGAGFQVVPSDTMYLLFSGAPGLQERLLSQHGILIRDYRGAPELEQGWYRIGVKSPEENLIFQKALQCTMEEVKLWPPKV